MKIAPPDPSELDEYYKSYLKYLGDDTDLLQALKVQAVSTPKFLSTLSEAMADYAYESGKWKLKEVIGHLSDSERIFSYRALCIARNDQTPLPAFDENSYVRNSNFGKRTLADIQSEYQSVRASTISLFDSLPSDTLDRRGVANQLPISPRILLYFILLHERHHIGFINSRYLASL